jgi:hypothetical protein
MGCRNGRAGRGRRLSARALLAATLLSAGAAALPAAEPAAEVDAEFLEFLGSLDTEDEDWREYLAERPVRAEAGKPATKPAAKPDTKEPPARKAEQQDTVKKP